MYISKQGMLLYIVISNFVLGIDTRKCTNAHISAKKLLYLNRRADLRGKAARQGSLVTN